MDSDTWNIVRAEGGFIVYVAKEGASCQPRVFTDSSTLLNFLHNELVGSN